MKNLLLIICLLMTSVSAMASTLTCRGADTTGKSIYLIADSQSPFVNINGSILRIVGRTRDNQGVVTETFVSTSGILVYDSILPRGYDGLTLYQFNAVTERLLAMANLTCRLSGTKILKEMRIFKL